MIIRLHVTGPKRVCKRVRASVKQCQWAPGSPTGDCGFMEKGSLGLGDCLQGINKNILTARQQPVATDRTPLGIYKHHFRSLGVLIEVSGKEKSRLQPRVPVTSFCRPLRRPSSCRLTPSSSATRASRDPSWPYSSSSLRFRAAWRRRTASRRELSAHHSRRCGTRGVRVLV